MSVQVDIQNDKIEERLAQLDNLLTYGLLDNPNTTATPTANPKGEPDPDKITHSVDVALTLPLIGSTPPCRSSVQHRMSHQSVGITKRTPITVRLMLGRRLAWGYEFAGMGAHLTASSNTRK